MKLQLLDPPSDVTTARSTNINEAMSEEEKQSLLDDTFALEKKQEAAVKKAADVLAAEFGAKTECIQFKIQGDNLMVIYAVKRPDQPLLNTETESVA